MNLCGRKACSSVSTEGLGAVLSSRLQRCTLTMSSSDSACRPSSACSGASRTAGSPGASMVPMSQPLPLTHSTSTLSPVTSAILVLTDVLPPPCSTSRGSPPSRRVV
jgi:hypothetical protein